MGQVQPNPFFQDWKQVVQPKLRLLDQQDDAAISKNLLKEAYR